MTNNYLDLKNATAYLVFSNFAESHPASMQFVWEGVVKNDAKLIVVEPRRTRAAKMGEVSGGRYVQVRSGFDIAYINGMIREVMRRQKEEGLYTGHLTEVTSRLWWPDDHTIGLKSLNWPVYSDACFELKVDGDSMDYDREDKTLADGATASNMPKVNGMTASGGDTPALEGNGNGVYTVYDYLWDRVKNYTPEVVEDICWCDKDEFLEATDMFINNSWAATHTTYGESDYQAGTIMYAMGTTQHSKGSHNTRIYCLLQMLLGNMGKPGGGVNALRGIGNVQGSTDMGLLFGNTVAYNFSQPWDPDPDKGDADMEDAFDRYFDGLFGNPFPETANGGVPTVFQQRGFHNLISCWFSDGEDTATRKADELYAFYPKGNGLNHRQFYQQTDPSMPGYRSDLPDIKAIVAWGHNPCSTSANQPLVRKAIKNLDTLVITEIFLTETAEADRKSDGVTYFLPAASFAETSGTIANSGRWIQRRWAGRDAVGNTKTDYEILLRLAKALHENETIVGGEPGEDKWPDANYDEDFAGGDNGFTALWGRYFLGDGAQDKMHPGDSVNAWDGNGDYTMPAGTFSKYLVNLLADNIYREMGAPLGGVDDPRTGVDRTWFGTLWIYSNVSGPGIQADEGVELKGKILCAYEPEIAHCTAYPVGEQIDRLDRANHHEGFISTDEEGNVSADFDGLLCKSYNPWDSDVTFRGEADRGLYIHPYWVIAWLFNRRVMYNMGTTTDAGDTGDLFVAADQVSKFFVHDAGVKNVRPGDEIPDTGPDTAPRKGGFMNYTRFYRHTGKFADPDFRVPRHVEAWESPLDVDDRAAIADDLAADDAPVTADIEPIGIAPPEAYAGTDDLRAQYPLIFTTFRYVMHYQGGAMSRNLSYINEIRPRPYLELHTEDADDLGINMGDDVYVQTMRGKNVGPFVALVADTIQKGVCGAPWHWGDTGLNTGPAANFACIDSLDLSTTMQETKACLCRVTKTKE